MAAPVSWRNLLSDARKARRLPESTVVCLGGACKEQPLPVPPFVGDEASRPVSHAILSFDSFEASAEQAQEADDTATRVSVWALSDAQFQTLLEPVLSPEQLAQTAFVVLLDMSTPWSLLDELQRWTDVIEQQAERLLAKLSMAARDDLRARLRSYLRRRFAGLAGEATTAEADPAETGPVPAGSELEAEDEDRLPPLPAEVLSAGNRGVPIVVVCCNCPDVEPEGNKRRQVASFVELTLRRFCLRHGAALVFVPRTLDGSNSPALLHRYLLHRLYPATFSFPADVGPPRNPGEAFWAAGADTPALQEQAQGGITEFLPDAPFDQVVPAPAPATPATASDPNSSDLADAPWLAQLESAQAQARAGSQAKTRSKPAEARPAPVVQPKAEPAKPPLAAAGEPSKSDMNSFWTGLLNKSPKKK